MRAVGLQSPRGYQRRSARALYDAHYGPNMTPMVDVVMVILIFFMASAAVLGPDWFLRAALPVQGTAPAGDKDTTVRVRLDLRVDSGMTVVDASAAWPEPRVSGEDQGGTGMDLGACEAFLKSVRGALKGRELAIVIDPADATPYEDVVRVHEQCQALGVGRVGLGPPRAK